MLQSHGRVIDRLSDYSDNSLLNELRRISGFLGKTMLSINDIEAHGRCSYATIKGRFGGLRNALKKAGLIDRGRHANITDEELLVELARIWDLTLAKEGRRPYKRDLVRYKSKFSEGPYYRRWGSWIKACEVLLNSDPLPSRADNFPGPPPVLAPKLKRAVPLRVRYAVFLRDNFSCQICGRSPALNPGLEMHVDHIVSEQDGGTLEPSNLRCLCADCNLGKGPHSERQRSAVSRPSDT